MNRSKFNANTRLGRNLSLVVFSAILCLGIALPPAASQEYRATLTVNVTDSTGAAVANAAVELTRGSTNQITRGVTDTTGTYIFRLLEPDNYSLQATAPTFTASAVTAIALQAY